MSETAKAKLWEKYAKNRTPELREQLILEYANVVNLVAGRLSMYLGHTVEFDDLVGYGIFGLIDAIDKFDMDKGVKFETYASLRIRGSILDQIRKMDWVPRTLRQKQRKIDTAIADLEGELGRPVSEDEIAEQLEITREEYENWKSQVQFTNLVSLDDYLEQGNETKMQSGFISKYDQPEKVIERDELKKMLAEALKKLTDNEMKVISFYYYEELTLKEISRILEVSESRISQLHTKALQKIKVQLGDSIDLINLFI